MTKRKTNLIMKIFEKSLEVNNSNKTKAQIFLDLSAHESENSITVMIYKNGWKSKTKSINYLVLTEEEELEEVLKEINKLEDEQDETKQAVS